MAVADALTLRKRPVQSRAKATFDAILEAAAQIIGSRGLEGFTTNAVAERAGVSIGSLYQYFASKDALMAALIERQQGRQAISVATAIAALEPGASLETAVRVIVRGAMQHHADDPLFASAIDHEELRLPIGNRASASLDIGGALLEPLFAHYRTEIGDVNPAVAARTLPIMVRAIVDAWANLSPAQLDHAEAEAVRAVLGYLRQDNRGDCAS
jgi:AcrR family transcriptional regulator